MAKEYTDFYGNKVQTDCIGCLPKDKPEYKGWRQMWTDGLFVAHQDFALPIPGMVILETVRHVQSVLDFTPEELKSYYDNRLQYKIRKTMQDVLGIKKVSFIQEESSSHFHQWFMPQYPWMDEIGGPDVENVQAIIDYAKANMRNPEVFAKVEEASEKLRAAFVSSLK